MHLSAKPILKIATRSPVVMHGEPVINPVNLSRVGMFTDSQRLRTVLHDNTCVRGGARRMKLRTNAIQQGM
jgi:hypothetical protein